MLPSLKLRKQWPLFFLVQVVRQKVERWDVKQVTHWEMRFVMKRGRKLKRVSTAVVWRYHTEDGKAVFG
jgi:hypothetical protein